MIRRRALDWNPFCGVAVADISLKSLEKFCVHQKISGYCRKTKKEVADVIVAWTIKNQPAAMDTEEEQAAAAAATAKPLLVVPETYTQTDAVSDSTMEHIELNQQQPDPMKEVAECLASCRSITKSAALVYHPVVYLLQTNNSTRRKGWLRQTHGTTIAGCNAKELRVLNTLLLVLSAAMVPMTQEERRDLVAFAFNIATSRMKVYCTNFFTANGMEFFLDPYPPTAKNNHYNKRSGVVVPLLAETRSSSKKRRLETTKEIANLAVDDSVTPLAATATTPVQALSL